MHKIAWAFPWESRIRPPIGKYAKVGFFAQVASELLIFQFPHMTYPHVKIEFGHVTIHKMRSRGAHMFGFPQHFSVIPSRVWHPNCTFCKVPNTIYMARFRPWHIFLGRVPS